MRCRLLDSECEPVCSQRPLCDPLELLFDWQLGHRAEAVTGPRQPRQAEWGCLEEEASEVRGRLSGDWTSAPAPYPSLHPTHQHLPHLGIASPSPCLVLSPSLGGPT